MRVRHQKEVNFFKLLTFVLMIAVLVLSFFPCNKINHYSGPWSNEITHTVQYVGFMPAFCVIITIIELLLLFLSNRMWSKVIRFVLNLVKITFPIGSFYFQDKLDEIICDIGGYNIYLGWSVYVIIGIGIVIGAVEIIDIITTEKKKGTAVSK